MLASPPPDKHHAPQWPGASAPRRFHVMAKPAGSACNLDCECYFCLSKEKLAGGPGTGRMDDEFLERLIADYIGSESGDEVVFPWRGGEPTRLGVAFFWQVVALQRRHAKPDPPLSVVTPWSADPDEFGHFLCKVWDEWLARDLGNVRAKSLGDMVFAPAQVRFGDSKSEALPQYCRECAYLTDCRANARRAAATLKQPLEFQRAGGSSAEAVIPSQA